MTTKYEQDWKLRFLAFSDFYSSFPLSMVAYSTTLSINIETAASTKSAFGDPLGISMEF